MKINTDTLNELIRRFGDDKDDLEMIVGALESFEEYHRAIYRQEISRRLFACGKLEGEDYRSEATARDKTRTRNHNAVIAQVNMLNRLAAEAGLPPLYDGRVSEERPYRREVADAVLEFVRESILNRL